MTGPSVRGPSLMPPLVCVSSDVLGNILKKLTAKRSRARVVDKLLSLGLVSERRELYKKKSRGARSKSSGKGMVKLVPLCSTDPTWRSDTTLSICLSVS